MNIREEFQAIQSEALALIATANADKRALSVEEKSAYDQKFSRMNEIKQILESEKQISALALEPEVKTEIKAEIVDSAIKAVATQSFTKMEHKMEVKDKNMQQIEGLKQYAKTGI